MDNLKFIKGFGKITVKKACEECKLNRSNVLNGYATSIEEEKVRKEIEKQIDNLYKECKKDEDSQV